MVARSRAVYLVFFVGLLSVALVFIGSIYLFGRRTANERPAEERLGTSVYTRHLLAGMLLGVFVAASVFVPVAYGHGGFSNLAYTRKAVAVELASVIFGCGVALRGAAHLRTALFVRRRKPTEIAEVEPGPTAVFGTARPAVDHDTVETPFTGQEALCYAYGIEFADEDQEKDATGNDGGSDAVGAGAELASTVPNNSTTAHGADALRSGTGGRPFYVEDDTESLLVDPERAAFGFDREAAVESPAGEDPPDRILDWLWERQIGTSPYGRRFVDRWLAPGDEVYVVGTAVERDGSPVVATREATGRFLVAATPPDDLAGSHRSVGLSQVATGLSLTVGGYLFLLSTFGVV